MRQPGLLGRSGDEEWGFREKVAVVLLVVFCFLILRGIRVLLLQHLTETALRTTGFVRGRAACVRLGPAVSCSAVPKPCLRAARLPFVVAVPGVSLGLASQAAIAWRCSERCTAAMVKAWPP